MRGWVGHAPVHGAGNCSANTMPARVVARCELGEGDHDSTFGL